VNRFHTLILAGALTGLPLAAGAQDEAAAKPKATAKAHHKAAAETTQQEKVPLKLVQSIPLPDLKDGDFDHLSIDLEGKRLFVTAEENGKVEVFDTDSNKLIQTIADLKAPHSMLYRGDLKKLFVVDSDLGEVKVYDTTNYNLVDSIKVREGADSSGYDPSTKYLYVVDGGKDAKMPNAYLDIIDTTAGKKVGEIKMDSDDVEAMAFDPSSSRMFIDIRGKSTVEVIDRDKRAVVATWPVPASKGSLTTISFDPEAHRLYIGGRTPAKLYVLDSDSGKVVTSVAAQAMVDDAAFSKAQKRIYFAGTEFTDVFEIKDADHVERIGHIPTSFRAKTALVVPELNRYYVAVPHHGTKSAEIRVYETVL
jgi:DNA-binding beta-propeller fold protein YncE